jgi:IMP dehydrogenase
MYDSRKEKLPLIEPFSRKIQGLITMRDLKLSKQKPFSAKDGKGRLLVGATIGATGDFMERAEALVSAEADVLLMDVAHADSVTVKKAMQAFRAKFKDVKLVCGNVGTGEGAKYLANLGADAVKVGIGPGRGCRTRLETGFGVPQLQAIREAWCATDGKVPIIADGGVKQDKDIFLAIVCGATAVMLGSMLSGTDEAPGIIIEDPATKQKAKLYRGMTSPEAVADGAEGEELQEALRTPAEGQSVKVPYVGSVVGILSRIRGHMQSAVSYAGAASLSHAREMISAQPGKYLELISGAAKVESFER